MARERWVAYPCLFPIIDLESCVSMIDRTGPTDDVFLESHTFLN